MGGIPLTSGSSDPPCGFPVGQAKTSEVCKGQTAAMVMDVSAPAPTPQAGSHSPAPKKEQWPPLPCHTP